MRRCGRHAFRIYKFCTVGRESITGIPNICSKEQKCSVNTLDGKEDTQIFGSEGESLFYKKRFK